MTIESDIAGLMQDISDVARKQLPFASAVALTQTAKDGQEATRKELKSSLTLRNKWSENGIQINRAEKKAFPATFAEVGIEQRRAYLIDHIEGNPTRRPRKGSRHAIPKAIKRTKTGRIPASKHIRKLKQRKDSEYPYRGGPTKRGGARREPFMINSRRTGNLLLVRRTSKSRYPLEVLYAFEDDVQIREAYDMIGSVQKAVNKTYAKNFGKALGKAIATAR